MHPFAKPLFTGATVMPSMTAALCPAATQSSFAGSPAAQIPEITQGSIAAASRALGQIAGGIRSPAATMPAFFSAALFSGGCQGIYSDIMFELGFCLGLVAAVVSAVVAGWRFRDDVVARHLFRNIETLAESGRYQDALDVMASMPIRTPARFAFGAMRQIGLYSWIRSGYYLLRLGRAGEALGKFTAVADTYENHVAGHARLLAEYAASVNGDEHNLEDVWASRPPDIMVDSFSRWLGSIIFYGSAKENPKEGYAKLLEEDPAFGRFIKLLKGFDAEVES